MFLCVKIAVRNATEKTFMSGRELVLNFTRMIEGSLNSGRFFA